MSFYIILIILVPILFVIGTIYNAIKEQNKLENGALKDILKRRAEEKAHVLKHTQNTPRTPKK